MKNFEHSIILEKEKTSYISGNFSNKQLIKEQNKNRQNRERE
jgi:hypothetical protein